jgi:hypothetical protein
MRIKLSERMKEIKLSVGLDMLVTEILPLVRNNLINADNGLSVGSTPHILAALQHVIYANEDHIWNVERACEVLARQGLGEDALAHALRHVCQTVAVLFHNTITASSVCTFVVKSTRSYEDVTSPVGIVDVATDLTSESTDGAVLTRAGTIFKRLCGYDDAREDGHPHALASFRPSLCMITMGLPRFHYVERLFISTFPGEWQNYGA